MKKKQEEQEVNTRFFNSYENKQKIHQNSHVTCEPRRRR